MDPRLKGKTNIDKIFSEGESLFQYPVKLYYIKISDSPLGNGIQYGVSVSKRNFKKAVDRNKIKRRMREAIRKQSALSLNNLPSQKYIGVMFLYISKDMLGFKLIEKSMEILIRKISKDIS